VGEWSASRLGRALAPGKGPPVPIVQEAGWAPEPVWTQKLEDKSFRLCRGSNLDHLVAQPVARHYTDRANWLTMFCYTSRFYKCAPFIIGVFLVIYIWHLRHWFTETWLNNLFTIEVVTSLAKTSIPDTLRLIPCCSSYRWRETMSLNCSHQQACCSSHRLCMSMDSHGGMMLTGESRRNSEKPCLSATLPTTNPTWTDQGESPGLRSNRPAANRPSHDKTKVYNTADDTNPS
jgi:hypothetical protein